MKRAGIGSMLCLGAAGLMAGCASSQTPDTPTPPSHNGGMFRERNEAYSLLSKLMEDDEDVSKIFILKSASEPVKGIIKEIAAACDTAKKQLDSFPQTNNRIEFDVPDLPKLEQKSRDLESRIDAKELLTSSDGEFEVRLIFSQAQAMGYASNLCAALVSVEDDEGHKKFLTDLSKQCGDFRNRLLGMLAVKS